MFEVQITVDKQLEDVWHSWTDEYNVTKWFFSSPDWYCPKAHFDFQPNGDFNITMAARDGSKAFPFRGTFTQIIGPKFIEYFTEDGRQVKTYFIDNGETTTVVQEIEPEMSNSLDTQREGWLNILRNFKAFTEDM